AYLEKPCKAKALLEAVSLLLYGRLDVKDVQTLQTGALERVGWKRVLDGGRQWIRRLQPRRVLGLGCADPCLPDAASAATVHERPAAIASFRDGRPRHLALVSSRSLAN